MMQRIVVGVDDTRAAQSLARWIETFAGELGAEVDVVHVVPRTLLLGISSVQLDSVAYVKHLCTQLERDVVSHLRAAGITARAQVERGDVARELARVATRVHADLIVVGGSDHRALHDVVAGGLAHRLEHHAAVPVVVVPLDRPRAHADR